MRCSQNKRSCLYLHNKLLIANIVLFFWLIKPTFHVKIKKDMQIEEREWGESMKRIVKMVSVFLCVCMLLPIVAQVVFANDGQANDAYVSTGEEGYIVSDGRITDDPEYRPNMDDIAPAISDSQGMARASTFAAAAGQSGWQTVGGNRYYYSNGKALTGYQTISGRKYYFDAKGVLTSKVGIDVSEWNGTIDWKKVKAAGVDYAIIRVGYRGYETGKIVMDKYFARNIAGANAAGVDCGVYFYTQAITKAEAREEARFVLKAIKGYTVKYPIVYDIEEVPSANARTKTNKLTNKDRTDFCIAFCKRIRLSLKKPMIYANKYWLTTALETSRLEKYDIWLAHYTNMTNYTGKFQMWQYSNTGKVSGISGNCDLNISLVDYAAKRSFWARLFS